MATPTIENRKARHRYRIEDTVEAGVSLKGSEVKSLRAGKANLQEAYARVKGGEIWLIGAHIAAYEQAGAYGHEDPTRSRRLLLKRREIDKLVGKVQKQGYTLVPLKLYFKRGWAKILLGVGKGKKTHDKRQDLKARDQRREMERYAKGGRVKI